MSDPDDLFLLARMEPSLFSPSCREFINKETSPFPLQFNQDLKGDINPWCFRFFFYIERFSILNPPNAPLEILNPDKETYRIDKSSFYFQIQSHWKSGPGQVEYVRLSIEDTSCKCEIQLEASIVADRSEPWQNIRWNMIPNTESNIDQLLQFFFGVARKGRKIIPLKGQFDPVLLEEEFIEEYRRMEVTDFLMGYHAARYEWKSAVDYILEDLGITCTFTDREVEEGLFQVLHLFTHNGYENLIPNFINLINQTQPSDVKPYRISGFVLSYRHGSVFMHLSNLNLNRHSSLRFKENNRIAYIEYNPENGGVFGNYMDISLEARNELNCVVRALYR